MTAPRLDSTRHTASGGQLRARLDGCPEYLANPRADGPCRSAMARRQPLAPVSSACAGHRALPDRQASALQSPWPLRLTITVAVAAVSFLEAYATPARTPLDTRPPARLGSCRTSLNWRSPSAAGPPPAAVGRQQADRPAPPDVGRPIAGGPWLWQPWRGLNPLRCTLPPSQASRSGASAVARCPQRAPLFGLNPLSRIVDSDGTKTRRATPWPPTPQKNFMPSPPWRWPTRRRMWRGGRLVQGRRGPDEQTDRIGTRVQRWHRRWVHHRR